MPIGQDEVYKLVLAGEAAIGALMRKLADLRELQREVRLGVADVSTLFAAIEQACADAPRDVALESIVIERWKTRYDCNHKRNEKNAARMKRKRMMAAGKDLTEYRKTVWQEVSEQRAPRAPSYPPLGGPPTAEEQAILDDYKAKRVPLTREQLIAAERAAFASEPEDAIDHAQAQPADAGMADLPDIGLAEGEEED